MKNKKEERLEKFWGFLKFLVIAIIFILCLAATVIPEICLWQAVVDGDVPWWIIFIGR